MNLPDDILRYICLFIPLKPIKPIICNDSVFDTRNLRVVEHYPVFLNGFENIMNIVIPNSRSPSLFRQRMISAR